MKKLIVTSLFAGVLMLGLGANQAQATGFGQLNFPYNPNHMQLPCNGGQVLPGCCGCQVLSGGCGTGSSVTTSTNVSVVNSNVLVGNQSVYSKNTTGGNVSIGNFGGSIVTGPASLTNTMTMSGNTNTTVIEINN